MSRLIKKRRGFTQVDNEIINDKTISLQAKGFYLFMESKPDNWEFSLSGMVSQLKESRTTILRIINELIKFGYLEKIKKRVGGKQAVNDYILYETPHKPLNQSEYQNETHKMGLTDTDSQIDTTSNTIPSNKEKSNTEGVKKPYPKLEISEEQINSFIDLKKFLVVHNKSLVNNEHFIFTFASEQVSISDKGILYFRTGSRMNDNLSFAESDSFYKAYLPRKQEVLEHINKYI